jgi:D-xylose transport system substrate-binding protein
VPHNADVAAAIVAAAKRQGVPVIAYDRMINSPDLDLYLSFDAVRIGEMQAKYLLERAPKGNYVVIGGAPTDNNARLSHRGQMNVLQPAVDRGDVKIVADQFCRDWLASEALNHTENALTQNANDVVAVVATNDGTAGGAIQALKAQRLDGKVLVSGQDAELAALQRIVAGTQSMTIYTPIELLARRAAEAAVALAKKQPVKTEGTVDNGVKQVPAVLLEPIVVDKTNIRETVVKDGYHKAEDIGL